jgi:hypothetical protein
MKIGDEMSWTVHLDGHSNKVRVALTSFWKGKLSLFINDEVVRKGTFFIWSRWRARKDGHEYLLSWTGVGFAGLYDLHVDGLPVNQSIGEVSIAQKSQL